MANFITVQNLKDNLAIQNNVDANLLSIYIPISQRLFMLPVLGTAQYESLENDITSLTLTGLTGTNATLQTKLKPALEFYCFYTALPYLQNKFTNKGIVQWEDNSSKPINEEKFDKIRKDILNWAIFEEQELLRFLRANKASYPLWKENNWSIYEMNSGATYSRTFFGGIEFDNGLNWTKIDRDFLP